MAKIKIEFEDLFDGSTMVSIEGADWASVKIIPATSADKAAQALYDHLRRYVRKSSANTGQRLN
jgi:hypothetical protein